MLGRDRANFVVPWPADNARDWLSANDIEFQAIDFTVGAPCEGGTVISLADDLNALLFRLWADDDTVEGPIRFNVVSDTNEQEDPFALCAPARGGNPRHED